MEISQKEVEMEIMAKMPPEFSKKSYKEYKRQK
jgi:hypothetical protein